VEVHKQDCGHNQVAEDDHYTPRMAGDLELADVQQMMVGTRYNLMLYDLELVEVQQRSDQRVQVVPQIHSNQHVQEGVHRQEDNVHHSSHHETVGFHHSLGVGSFHEQVEHHSQVVQHHSQVAAEMLEAHNHVQVEGRNLLEAALHTQMEVAHHIQVEGHSQVEAAGHHAQVEGRNLLEAAVHSQVEAAGHHVQLEGRNLLEAAVRNQIEVAHHIQEEGHSQVQAAGHHIQVEVHSLVGAAGHHIQVEVHSLMEAADHTLVRRADGYIQMEVAHPVAANLLSAEVVVVVPMPYLGAHVLSDLHPNH
jgi:hypothetical protein